MSFKMISRLVLLDWRMHASYYRVPRELVEILYGIQLETELTTKNEIKRAKWTGMRMYS